MEHRDDVIALLLHVQIGHFKMTVLDSFLLVDGPILAALWPSAFHTAGGHDHYHTLLFPDHPPEIAKCLGQRALS